jgi:hypothetical protein
MSLHPIRRPRRVQDDPRPAATQGAGGSPAEHALAVIARTVSAWGIAPASAREVARRAPHGYVPVRIMRRLRAAAAAAASAASAGPAFAHSW